MNDLAAVAKVEIFDEFKAALADDQSLHQCAKLIDVKSIDYLFYKKLVKKCPEAIKKFLTMDVFLILANPKTHEVEREDLIRYAIDSLSIFDLLDLNFSGPLPRSFETDSFNVQLMLIKQLYSYYRSRKKVRVDLLLHMKVTSMKKSLNVLFTIQSLK